MTYLDKNHNKLKVGFILAPKFTLIAFAGFIDALRLAADEGDRSQKNFCDWEILGVDNLPIISSCGVSVMPTVLMDDPSIFDYLVIVGGLLHGVQSPLEKHLKFLRSAASANVNLVGLCTGSFLLAKAGLLNGYLSCISWFHRDEFIADYPKCRFTSNQMFVIDRDRMTCAGGTSVVHLAAYIIEKHISRSMAVKALRVMLENQPLPSTTLQPEKVLTKSSRDPMVHKAMLVIEQFLQYQGPVTDSLNSLGIGRRQLERKFSKDIGISPAQYRLLLRLQRAVTLLRSSNISITDVALESGFKDSSQFSRFIKIKYGISPKLLREQLKNQSLEDVKMN